MIKQKNINNYDNYSISSDGVILNNKTGKFLKPNINKGYHSIRLYKNNTPKKFLIHKLVQEHFGDNNNIEGYQIDHIDNNKSNNSIDNLQLLTCRENNVKRCLNKHKTSKYTGVSWSKIAKKQQATITVNKKIKYLGYYDNEHEAAEAYKNELIKINEVTP